MENKLNGRSLLLIALSLLASACSKESEFIYSGETVDQRFRESLEWNSSHSSFETEVGSDDYTLLIMADSHTGGTTNLDQFFSIAKAKKPAAVVMDGDLTGGLSEEYKLFESHLPQNDSLPLFFITGNHDLWYNGWEEFYSRFGSSTYYFIVKTDTGSDLYICLDTGGTTLGSLQMKWLVKLLETKRSQYRNCVIITHINLFRPRHTESTNPNVEEIYAMIDLFTRNRVDMVVTGHDHKQDAQQFGVTTYIQVAALEDGLSYAGYMELKVKNGKLGYNFLKISE